MGKLPAEERPKVGQLVNEVKSRIESSIDNALGRLDAAAENQALEAGRFDLTRPGRQVGFGASHPLKQVERTLACLERLGFTVADGPQVEHDWHNFEALNIPGTIRPVICRIPSFCTEGHPNPHIECAN